MVNFSHACITNNEDLTVFAEMQIWSNRRKLQGGTG
jgi:hypothetical protein